MVHTLPDYTSKWKNKTISNVVDSAELAARLGSINTFDRRGNIVWMDDFESDTSRWRHGLTGGRGSITTSAERCWMGSSSYKLVTGATSGDVVYITKYFSVPSSSRIGVELHVHSPGTNNEILVLLYGDDGVNQYDGQLIYNVPTDTVAYEPSAGADVPLKRDVLNIPAEHIWIPLKMVIDWDTKRYVRAIVEDLDTDLSDQLLPTLGTTNTKFICIYIRVTSTAAGAQTVFLDNVILTQNEV